MLIKNKNGFGSIFIVIILMFLFSLFLMTINLDIGEKYKEYSNYILSNKNAKVGIDDAISLFENNKFKYLNTIDFCSNYKNGTIPFIVNKDKSLDDFNKLNFDFFYNYRESNLILDENTNLDNNGFVNRKCSLLQEGYPSSYNSIMNLKNIEGINNISDIRKDSNGFYNIGLLGNNENKGFLFSLENLKKEDDSNIPNNSNLKIKLSFDLIKKEDIEEKYLNLDYLSLNKDNSKIYDLIEKNVNNVKDFKNNLKNDFLYDIMSIYNNTKVELGLVSFDGKWDNNGYNIDLNTKPKVIDRKICGDYGNFLPKECLLNFNVENNKIYFLYLKGLGKSTSINLQILDNFDKLVYFPTGDLIINVNGYSNDFFVSKNKVVKTDINSDLDSSVFNYLYFSN